MTPAEEGFRAAPLENEVAAMPHVGPEVQVYHGPWAQAFTASVEVRRAREIRNKVCVVVGSTTPEAIVLLNDHMSRSGASGWTILSVQPALDSNVVWLGEAV